MPFNVWCLGCERHIARGVRFNAEKKQAGTYYSTPVWSFRMKCPSCAQWIEVHTDPKATDYTVVSGGRRKNESWAPAENGTEALEGPSARDAAKKAENPFFRLECDVDNVRRAEAARPQLESLKAGSGALFRDDWQASQEARRQFRARRAEHAKQLAEAEAIRTRGQFALRLLPEHPEDVRVARETAGTRPGRDRRTELLQEGIFARRKSSRRGVADARATEGSLLQSARNWSSGPERQNKR